MQPAGRIRLLHQVAHTAEVTPSEAERRLKDAEKIVYRSSRLAGSATTFGPLGRVVASLLAVVPVAALGIHAYMSRGQPTAVIEVVLAVVPAFFLAVLVLRDVWQASKKPERVMVASRLDRTRP
jgi:hypothetical protein